MSNFLPSTGSGPVWFPKPSSPSLNLGGTLGGVFGGSNSPFGTKPLFGLGSTTKGLGGAVTKLGGSIAKALPIIGMAIPIASLLGNLAGFDIKANISNVTKYGLNSWGASTSPEAIGGVLNEAQNKISAYAQQTQAGDLDALNDLSRFINWGDQFYSRMRRNHAKASSTKKAYDMAIAFYKKQKVEILDKLTQPLVSSGVVMGSVASEEMRFPFNAKGKLNDVGDPAIMFTLYKLNPNYKMPLTATKEDGTQQIVDEDGKPISESGSGGIIGLAIAGFLLTKFMK